MDDWRQHRTLDRVPQEECNGSESFDRRKLTSNFKTDRNCATSNVRTALLLCIMEEKMVHVPTFLCTHPVSRHRQKLNLSVPARSVNPNWTMMSCAQHA